MQPRVSEGKSKSALAIGVLLVLAVIWGAGFVFNKMALNEGIAPSLVLLGRFGLASVILFIVYNRDIRTQYQKGQWKGAAVLGALLFGGYWLQTVGLGDTTPGNSAFITATSVVMVPLFSWMFTKQKPAPLLVAACFTSLLGAGILSLDVSAGFSMGMGDLLTLLSTVLFAVQISLLGVLTKTIQQNVLVFIQLFTCAVLSLLAFGMAGFPLPTGLEVGGYVAVGYLGVMCTAAGFTMQTYGQRHLDTSLAAIILAGESLVGTALSVALGYEPFTARMLVGGLVITASLVAPPVWQLRREKQQRQQAALETVETADAPSESA